MSDYDFNLLEETVVSYTNVQLNNTPNYTTNFIIDGFPLFMQVGYSSRMKMRWLSLEDRVGNLLIPQTYIDYGRRVDMNENAHVLDLDYYLTLKPKNEFNIKSEDYDYINWADDYTLCFVGTTYDLTERGNTNLRVVLTGN